MTPRRIKERPLGETQPKMPGMGSLPNGKWNRGNRTASHRGFRYRLFEEWDFSKRQKDSAYMVLLALKEDRLRRQVELFVLEIIVLLEMLILKKLETCQDDN